jgi:hypothetical protein
MFCYSMKDKLETTLLCFSIWLKHTLDFQCFITHDFFLCYFSCYNMVAKFYCQDYVSYAHVLSAFILALNALLR